MALFSPGVSRCPLCGGVLHHEDDRVATTHFIGDASDPFYRFSDASMHRACFLKWDRRREFVRKHNSVMGWFDRLGMDGRDRPWWKFW